MASIEKSLCVCATPLHVLVTRRISAVEGSSFSHGVFVTSSDNAKQRHYADLMREFCAKLTYIVLPGEANLKGQKHAALWKYRVSHRANLAGLGDFEALYISSAIDPHLFMLLSQARFSRLITFDDGVINVNPDSLLFTSPTRLRTKLFFYAAGITYWPERIRARSSTHYSIYDGENICQRVKRITLADAPSGAHASSGAENELVKILLGSPPEASPDIWDVLLNAVSRVQPDLFLPHPREKLSRVRGIAYLETPLVIEDYVLTQLSGKPGLRFQIFGYDSAALVNLATVPRVEAVSLLGKETANDATRRLMERNGVRMFDALEPERRPLPELEEAS